MNKSLNIALQPGRYWIGDLCYVMHARWSEFCEHLDEAGEVLTMDGEEYWWHHTAFGDGTYDYDLHNLPDGLGVSGGFGVDAGLIGIIPAALVGRDPDDDPKLGMWLEFKKPVHCSYLNGTFVFNDGDIGVQIYTKD